MFIIWSLCDLTVINVQGGQILEGNKFYEKLNQLNLGWYAVRAHCMQSNGICFHFGCLSIIKWCSYIALESRLNNG